MSSVLAQATFYVTNLKNTGTGSLRAAVLLAEADGNGDTIRFDPSLAGATIRLSPALQVTEDLTINGEDAPGVTLSGGWDGVPGSSVGNRVLESVSGKPDIYLRHLRLTEGNGGAADDDAPHVRGVPNSNGGLVYTSQAQIFFGDCILSGATAWDGGLVKVQEGQLVAHRTTFAGGQARDDAGAIHTSKAIVTLESCTLAENIAGYSSTNGVGLLHDAAAIYSNEADLLLLHATIAYNEGPTGLIVAKRKLRVSNTLLVNNTAGTGAEYVGGGYDLKNFDDGTLVLADGVYSDNDAAIASFNATTADEAALAPLATDALGYLVCEVSCASTLSTAVTGRGDDQRGTAYPQATAPGAIPVGACADADGDGVPDAAAPDDDGDAIDDGVELSFLPTVSTDFGAGGASIANATSTVVDGVTVTFLLDGPTANFSTGGDIDLAHSSTNPSSEGRIELLFDEPVYALSFTLSGLDQDRADLVETMEVAFYDGTTPVYPDATEVAVGTGVNANGGRYAATSTGSPQGSSAKSVSRAQATAGAVAFGPLSTPVTRVVLSSGFGNPPTATPGAAAYGLTQLTFARPSLIDADADGLPLTRDADADGDGLIDRIEAQLTDSYSATATEVTPIDTDGDGVPDFLDLDSDDDGEPDAIEGHDSNNDGAVTDDDLPLATNTGRATGADVDGDGVDDGYDDSTTSYARGGFGNPPVDYPREHGLTGEIDFRDADDNVAGYVWHDEDEDGTRDANEVGIDGATVQLRRVSDDLLVGTALTAPDGRYLFLHAGGGFGNPSGASLYVEVPTPGGFGDPTIPQAAPSTREDSDLDPVSNKTAAVTVAPGTPAAFLGAGFRSAPVPVEWLDHGVRQESNCEAEVYWVAIEDETSHYEVRTRDGEVRATVPAEGLGDYSAQGLPLSAEYVRVVAIDLDGSETVTAWMYVPACMGEAEELRAFPNPVAAGDVLRIAGIAADVAPVELRGAGLYDVRGARVAPVRPSAEGASVATTGLPAGLYVLRVGVEVRRIVLLAANQ